MCGFGPKPFFPLASLREYTVAAAKFDEIQF